MSAALRTLHGDSRGRWDGDTMVVETTNFGDRTAFRGSSEHLKVTERFTLVDATTIRYQFTVEDPHTWDRPWSGEYPMTRISEADLRVRLPRRQLRDAQHPESAARGGSAGAREGRGATEQLHTVTLTRAA